MKKLVEVTEVEGEGLMALMGQTVTIMCMNYFYTGKLIGVNDKFIKLENPSIVYDTGPFTNKTWQDAQRLPNDWYVQVCSIESFGILK